MSSPLEAWLCYLLARACSRCSSSPGPFPRLRLLGLRGCDFCRWLQTAAGKPRLLLFPFWDTFWLFLLLLAKKVPQGFKLGFLLSWKWETDVRRSAGEEVKVAERQSCRDRKRADFTSGPHCTTHFFVTPLKLSKQVSGLLWKGTTQVIVWGLQDTSI